MKRTEQATNSGDPDPIHGLGRSTGADLRARWPVKLACKLVFLFLLVGGTWLWLRSYADGESSLPVGFVVFFLLGGIGLLSLISTALTDLLFAILRGIAQREQHQGAAWVSVFFTT